MNEQDKKIVDLYLKDIKRKKTIVFIITVAFFICTIIFKLHTNNLEPKELINVVEENNQNTSNKIINKVENKNDINIIEGLETTIQNNTITNIQKTSKEVTNKKETTDESLSISKKNEIESIKSKPTNKKFLFKDGYNMENVSKAAQEYLTSSGFSGKCIPIKDEEGIYLGMEVVFD